MLTEKSLNNPIVKSYYDPNRDMRDEIINALVEHSSAILDKLKEAMDRNQEAITTLFGKFK